MLVKSMKTEPHKYWQWWRAIWQQNIGCFWKDTASWHFLSVQLQIISFHYICQVFNVHYVRIPLLVIPVSYLVDENKTLVTGMTVSPDKLVLALRHYWQQGIKSNAGSTLKLFLLIFCLLNNDESFAKRRSKTPIFKLSSFSSIKSVTCNFISVYSDCQHWRLIDSLL